MSLQMSPVQFTRDQIVDLRSVDISVQDRRRSLRSKFPTRFEEGVTISLEHLDVALAVKAEKESSADKSIPYFKVSAKRLDHNSVAAEAVPAAEKSEDPVIRRLSDALAATEAAHDPHSAICADALRLAILTRRFSQQADVSPEIENPAGRNVRSLQKWRLKRVVQYVDERLGAKITLEDLAKVAGLSRMHFAAQFRAAMGMRPHEYLLKRRIERAEELLKRAEVSLVEIALTVGFQTQAHFTTVFKRFAGDTPYQWRSAWLAQSMPLPSARVSVS